MISIKTDLNRFIGVVNATDVSWQLSRYCENNCHYCIAHDEKQTIKNGQNEVEYSEKEIMIHDNIFGLLNEMETATIKLYGGEPTLHPKGIAYFNALCKEAKKKPNKTIILVTHGMISYAKIDEINTYGCDTHLLSVSYHYNEVKDFEEWKSRVLKLNSKTNVMVSAIIPRNKRRKELVWDDFEGRILSLYNEGISIELKLEQDKHTGSVDVGSMDRFRGLAVKMQKDNRFISDIQIRISDENRSIPIEMLYAMSKIPLKKNFTHCTNTNFIISSSNQLGTSCSMGSHMQFAEGTTRGDFIDYLVANGSISCGMDKCDGGWHQMDVKVYNADLEEDSYKLFLENI